MEDKDEKSIWPCIRYDRRTSWTECASSEEAWNYERIQRDQYGRTEVCSAKSLTHSVLFLWNSLQDILDVLSLVICQHLVSLWKKWFCGILRNYHVKRHKKSVAGQSVDKETEVKDIKQRPMIKIDMGRHASKESEFIDEDLLRIEVSDRRRLCSCFGDTALSLRLSSKLKTLCLIFCTKVLTHSDLSQRFWSSPVFDWSSFYRDSSWETSAAIHPTQVCRDCCTGILMAVRMENSP